VPTKPILLIRASGNESDAEALAQVGLTTVIEPFLKIEANRDPAGANHLLEELKRAGPSTWVIATSANSIQYWAEIVGINSLRNALDENHNLRFAAVGSSTAKLFREYGAREILLPPLSSGRELLKELLLNPPAQAIMPIGSLTLHELQDGLTEAGWNVVSREVYTNEIVTTEPEVISRLKNNEFGALILRSPSAVRALLRFLPHPTVPLVCGGQSAANELLKVGLRPAGVSENPDPHVLAQLVQEIVRGGSK